jgi:hypothetical protein
MPPDVREPDSAAGSTPRCSLRRLYERLGWIHVGGISGYALLPRGGLCELSCVSSRSPTHMDRALRG